MNPTRIGRRSATRLLVGTAGAASLGLATGRAAEPVDVELVLAADGSGSIDNAELAFQRRGYAEALNSPEVLAAITGGLNGAIALTYIEWGAHGSYHTIVGWAKIDGPAAARAFGDRLVSEPRAAMGYNAIAGVIIHSIGEIRSNRFDGYRKVVDVSADSVNRGGPTLRMARTAAQAENVTVNGLVIDTGGVMWGAGGSSLAEYFRSEVIHGFGSFVEVAQSRETIATAIRRKMVLEIAGLPHPGGRAAG